MKEPFQVCDVGQATKIHSFSDHNLFKDPQLRRIISHRRHDLANRGSRQHFDNVPDTRHPSRPRRRLDISISGSPAEKALFNHTRSDNNFRPRWDHPVSSSILSQVIQNHSSDSLPPTSYLSHSRYWESNPSGDCSICTRRRIHLHPPKTVEAVKAPRRNGSNWAAQASTQRRNGIATILRLILATGEALRKENSSDKGDAS